MSDELKDDRQQLQGELVRVHTLRVIEQKLRTLKVPEALVSAAARILAGDGNLVAELTPNRGGVTLSYRGSTFENHLQEWFKTEEGQVFAPRDSSAVQGVTEGVKKTMADAKPRREDYPPDGIAYAKAAAQYHAMANPG